MAARRSNSRSSSSPRRRSSGEDASRPSSVGGAGATRAQVVWLSFLGAMTLVGGLLLLVDGKPTPRIDGLSLSPLAAASTINSVAGLDPVLQTRRAIDKPRWRAIVIHHSASLVGSPTSITREHESRGIKGLGHHFLIGNGQGMDDGQVHIGFRWLEQLPGAHAAGEHGDWYNHHSVSICIVGDGNRRPFTPAQMHQLSALVESLRKQLELPAERVFLYSDLVPGASSPGKLFSPGALLGLNLDGGDVGPDGAESALADDSASQERLPADTAIATPFASAITVGRSAVDSGQAQPQR
jgi:N-acetylmuramoyl-L-alanine amidase